MMEMKLENLKANKYSLFKEKRVGRGPGSGHGKTSCRGHKGQKARSGGGVRPGFEGGQTPLYRRIPKRGFTHKKIDYSLINMSDLSMIEGKDTITAKEFFDLGFIKNIEKKVKILGDGELKKSLTVQADAFTKSAIKKIENAGGKVIITPGGN